MGMNTADPRIQHSCHRNRQQLPERPAQVCRNLKPNIRWQAIYVDKSHTIAAQLHEMLSSICIHPGFADLDLGSIRYTRGKTGSKREPLKICLIGLHCCTHQMVCIG
jgi:hypothetical protein